MGHLVRDLASRVSAGPYWLESGFHASWITHSRASPPDAFTRLFASVLRRRHHSTRLRFGVLSPATASPHRINRPASGTTGKDPSRRLPTARPARPGSRRRTHTECDMTSPRRIGRAPLLRFSSPSAFAGCARVLLCGGCQPSARSRFIVPSCRPALWLSCGPAGITPTLRVFASGPFSGAHGHVAMKLVWRAYAPSVGAEFVAHVSSRPGSGASTRFPGKCQDVAATRRPCCSRPRTPSTTDVRGCVR